jgi:hypothetical protein
MLRPTVSRPVGQSASLSRNKALRPDFCYCQTVAGLLMWGALCDERAGLSFCCCPSPAQSFSGPSPVGLTTIFYCLRFETFLFVASYDSQGYGEGIRSGLHTEYMNQVQVQVTLRLTVSQSVCLGVEPRPGLMTRY